MCVCRKKTAAVAPEQRPDLFPVGIRQVEKAEFRPGIESEHTLPMRRRYAGDPLRHLEEKHQPVSLPEVTVFADKPGQMQVRRRDSQSGFLLGLAAGAGVRRFAGLGLQFASRRAEVSPVRLLRALQ